jgi:hypothetical protein
MRPTSVAALTIAALMAAGTALTACGAASPAVDGLGVPLHQPVTEQQLRHHPQASLVFPGSLPIRQIGADEHAHPGDNDPDPAYAGVLATTGVPSESVIAWYDQQLTARGYRPAAYYRPADQDTGAAWTIPHSREQIQVGIYAPSAAASVAGSTTYEELLVSYRVTGPPPPP